MVFTRVELDVPEAEAGSVRRFYRETLGLAGAGDGVRVGETTLAFRASARDAFYHFALLVPGDRFDAARAWAAERTTLLPDPESGSDVFDFDNWDARACYFHDPAGNIVELIAHRPLERNGAAGAFDPDELAGFSELGLVGDPPVLANELHESLGLVVWDGTTEEPGRLAFVGERARTLILAPNGRGWLPTGRPGEPHPVRVVLADGGDADVTIDGIYELERRA